LMAQVGLLVGGHRLTAVIPADALDDLRLCRGAEAVAIIKTSDVIIAKAFASTRASRRHRQ